MLIINHTVPEALILPEQISDLKAHLCVDGAHWFCSDFQYLTLNADMPPKVSAVQSCTTAATAVKTPPNKNHTEFAAQTDHNHLLFLTGVHCGFALPDLPVDPQNWSCAIRFHAPENDARTLMTLNPEGTKNYIFLQQVMGQMILKDQQTTLQLSRTLAPRNTPALVIVGMSEGHLWLRLDGETAQSTRAEIDMAGPFSLFLGCRSNKARLLKTLGHFHLFDVVFWPDRNILAPGSNATVDALEQSHLWRPVR